MLGCRKALYNIGKKTIKCFEAEMYNASVLSTVPESPLEPRYKKRLKIACKIANKHTQELEELLPKAAIVHVNELYEACLHTQSACMAVSTALADSVQGLDDDAFASIFPGGSR